MMEGMKFDPSINILQRRDVSLDKIFHPKSIAVIGATDKENSVGRTILWNLLFNPFGGVIYPINPKRSSVLGIKAYPSISRLPEKVDLAVIVTPSKTVPKIIEECGREEIRAAIIISAGFKEMGESGLLLEKEILHIARRDNIRIIGPNCLGVMNPVSGLNATFAADMAMKGNVAFLSQSGALCTAVLDWSIKEKVGFSSFVSVGSMIDVNWGDLITYFGNDSNTKSILIYMESIGDPRSFLSAAREVALTKPIILIKAGKTEESAKAAVSHTGAMAGSDAVLNAALKRVGVLRVDSIADLFSMADILSKQPLPRGPSLSIITNAGGPAVIATDTLVEMGGEVADLSEDILTKLNQFLPPEWSHNNPIDIIGDASPDRYEKTMDVIMNDESVAGVLVILTPQNMTDSKGVAEKMKKFAGITNKPILASWMGADRVAEGRKILSQEKIPTFEYPDYACRAFANMWKYSYNLQCIYETPAVDIVEVDETELLKRNKLVNEGFQSVIAEKRTILDEIESKKILETYNIPTVPTKAAKNVDEAIEIAEKMGFPVVLKLYSRSITHKKATGGVKLNLNNKDAVRNAYNEIYESIKNGPGVKHFLGVTVQPMVKLEGYEIILGSSTDPLFGPTVLFGGGGSMVEVFNDTALGLPPLNSTLAMRVMEQTKIFDALKIRGRKLVDLDLLQSIFVQFSNLVTEYPIIKESDINPILVSADKIVALDARFILFDEGEIHPKVAIRPYPIEYIKFTKLNDGTPIIIRPIRPEDELLMVNFLRQLSKKSILNRYLKAFNYDALIAKQRLIRMCCNDYDREIAIVAETKKETKSEILGIARLIKSTGIEGHAVISLIVKDKWQNKKIGSQLLQNIIDIGTNEGLMQIEAQILKENKPMVNICKNLGFTVSSVEGKDFYSAEYKTKNRK